MPEPQTVVVDATPLPQNPVDPNVKVPASVKAAADRANAFYSQNPPAPAEVRPVEPPKAPAAPAAPAAAPATPEPPKAPAAPPPPPEPPPAEGTVEHEHARYLSMKGRFDASQKTIGQMQEQMAQLGDELMRTQQALTRPRAPAAPPPPPLLTPEDEATFGPELIDFARRAAIAAVTPQLSALEEENQRLRQQVTKVDRQSVNAQLAQEVPNWREINQNPRWHNWLRLPDVYSGQVRQQMLDDATARGDASRVIAFFKGFLAEEHATGHVDPASPPPAAAPLAPPREAAIPLEALAAPGRPRPASGSDVSPSGAADKPVITRAQVSEFYANVRKGAYRGQDTLKAQHEQMIFAAQRDGRIR